MLEGEGLPFVESDDFIAVPELPTTEELLRLAAMPERSEDEEYRLTALLELINIMTAKEVVTDYEITKPREHIKVEEVSGEVPSGRPGEERGLPDDALAAAFLMNPPAMPKPADERPPVEEMATQEKAPRAPATPHAEASAAAPPGAAAPTAVPDSTRCHFYMRYDLSTDKSEIIDAVTGRLYAPADLGIPDDADMKFLGRDATTEYYSIDLYEESYHKVIGLKRSDDGLIRVSSGLQVEGGYKWGSLDDRFIFAKTQVGYKCFDSKTGKVSSVDEKGRLVNAQFIESTGELMLILERRNGMLELVRFDPRKMEPAGMPIPLWKGRGTDAEFDQIGPFVHIRAVGRRPFRLKGEGVVITRYGEVYRDIAEIEVHLPDGLLITKNAKGGNTSIIRTKTGKDGEQAGTEMYYVDGKYKVYHNGVTGAWEILAKAKEARGSRLRWFGGAYAKSRISRWPCLPDKAGLYDISDDANFYRIYSRWRPETKELELSESMAKELGINRQPLAASYNPAWDLFVVEIPGPEKRRAIVDIPGRKVFWMQSSLVAENIIYYDREKGEIGIDYDSRLHVVSDGKETDYGVFKHNYLSGGNATYYVPGRCVSVSIDADSLRPEAHTAEIDDRAAEGYKFVAFDNGYLVFIKSGTTEFKYLKIPEAARAAEEARPAPVEPPAAGPAPAETAPVLSDEEQMKRIDTLLKSNGLTRAGRLIGTSGRAWILDLSDTAVSDISLLEGCTNIEDLRLSRTNIKDLTPIRGLKNLKFLRLNKTRVGDLTPLADLTGLIELDIGSTQVMDLTPLANLKGLSNLDIGSTRVRGLTPLFEIGRAHV